MTADGPTATLTPLRGGACAVGVAVGVLLPETFASTLSWGLFALVMVLVGVPHGGVDDLLAARRWPRLDRRTFYAAYLGVVAGVVALWVVWPVAALTLFLGVTAYHFGQGDLEVTAATPRRGLVALRGAAVLGLLLLARPEITRALLSDWAGVGAVSFTLEPSVAHGLLGGLLGVYLVAFARHARPEVVLREAVGLGALAACFFFAPPPLAFAVYFGVWHSGGFVQAVARRARPGDGLGGPLGVLWRGRRHAIAASLGLAAGFGVFVWAGTGVQAGEALRVLAIGISALTVPHVFVADRLITEVPATA